MKPISAIELADGVYVLDGAVRTGVVVRDGRALLIDCCETVTPERLAALRADRVEMICMTQHRRPNAMGAYRFVEEQGAQLVVSEKDRALFEDVEAYWADWKNRWHVYHMQPGPQVLHRPIKVTRTVTGGDTIEWRGVTLRVLATPGATEGAVSYLVDCGGKRIAFAGDLLCGPGRMWDLYSLQKGFRTVGDYHGFLGMREELIKSLHALSEWNPDLAVTSHAAPFGDVPEAAHAAEQRLNELQRNYAAISALNHYFPSQFEDLKDDPLRMKPAERLDPPTWVRRVAFTTYAVISASGDALLIDCGQDSVLTKIDEWQKDKSIRNVDACWVTHYHDDHVDSLYRLAVRNIPIWADARMADIIENPRRHFLPCISPNEVPVARKTTDGESRTWREFTLTAYHFPGQTLYHGGLLVEGNGKRVFFAGDSGAPTGLDDYCAGNRTFLGPHRGSRRCLEIWRTIKPDYILNEHQDKAFVFTEEQLDYMDHLLAEREELVKALTPWDNANFAMDEYWIRAYPYEQEASPGDTLTLQVHVTNHSASSAPVTVEPILPAEWTLDREKSIVTVEAPANTDGWVTPGAARPDAVLTFRIAVPADARSGLHVLPLSVDYRERKLGAFRHALVRVR